MSEVKKFNILDIFKSSYFILGILVFFVVFINSMSSPIYDVALMNDDAHLFYVLGRALKAGKVAYLDVFDHKGLYLFFIGFLGSFFEYKHIGLFIMHFFIVYVNAILVFKIIKNYISETLSLLGAMFIAVLHVSHYFSYGAFQGESLLLPFLTIGYYLAFLYFKNIKEDDMSHKPIYMLGHGIIFGILFLTKSNLALPWVPFAVIILCILLKNKLYKNLFINILYGIIGVIIAAIPVLIYCLINNCLFEMIDATYFFNMRYIGESELAMSTKEAQVLWYVKNYIYVAIAIILSSIIFCKNKSITTIKKIAYFSALIISIASIMMAGRAYEYYANAVMIYFVPLIIYVLFLFDRMSKDKSYKNVIAIFGIIILYVYSVIVGRNFTIPVQEHMLRSANAIREVYADTFPNKRKVKVFTLGSGSFVYNSLGAIPDERYFFTPHAEYDKVPELYEEMYDYIRSFKADFIVVCLDAIMITNKENTKKMLRFLDERYTLVSNALGLYMYKKK